MQNIDVYVEGLYNGLALHRFHIHKEEIRRVLTAIALGITREEETTKPPLPSPPQPPIKESHSEWQDETLPE